MKDVRCRLARSEDFTFLATMLGEAAVWRPDKDTPSADQVLADPRAAREWLHDALRRNDFAQVFGSGNPTLILVAEHDRIVNVPRLASAVAGAPDVSFDVIRQAGHAWSPELSRRQRTLIAAFLDDQPLPRSDGVVVAA